MEDTYYQSLGGDLGNGHWDSNVSDTEMVNRMKQFAQDRSNSVASMNAVGWSKPNILHRLRALCCNTISKHKRQYCQHICQVILPLLMLIIPIVANMIAYVLAKAGGGLLVTRVPSETSHTNNDLYKYTTTSHQSFNSPVFGDVGQRETFMGIASGRNYLMAINGQNESVIGSWYGNLKEYKASGMLKNLVYELENAPYPPGVMTFNASATTFEMENRLSELLAQRSWATRPGGAVSFDQVDPEKLSLKLRIHTDINSYDADSQLKQLLYSMTDVFMMYTRKNPLRVVDASSQEYLLRYRGGGGSFADISTAILFPLSISFLVPMYLFRMINERKKGLVDFTLIFGVKRWEYDMVEAIFEYMYYLFIVGLTLVVGFSFQFRLFYLGKAYLYIPLLLIWGVTMNNFALFLTLFIKTEKRASILGYVIMLASMAIAALCNLFLFDTSMPPVYYMLYPPFAFFRGIYMVVVDYSSVDALTNRIDFLYIILYLVGENIVMYVLGARIGWSQVTRLFKFLSRTIRSTKQTYDIEAIENSNRQDADAREEYSKVNKGLVPETSVLVIKNLVRKFTTWRSSKTAVNNLCLTFVDKQTFGLLGPNGAGKSTLIGILSGNISPSSGTAYVCGYDVSTDIETVRQMIGFCPQFDILYDSITVEEHLLFYARLRGIKRSFEREHVQTVIEEVGLEEARRRFAKDLSGGMKRRLSIAISIIGYPRVVFLDEPSTGLDPASRKGVWGIIKKIQNNRSIILTTHSMAEAEHLCQRIGIMTSGELRCVGSLSRLKELYGEGYRITLSCDRSDHERIFEFMKHNFPNAILESTFAGTVYFRLATKDMKLSHFFETMKNKSGKVGVKDWSVNQASLEEVFLKMAENDS